MSRLLEGSLILLFLLVVNLLTALVQSGAASTTAPPGCKDSEDASSCDNVGKTSFVKAVAKTAVKGIEGAPTWFNAVWLLVAAMLLTVGVLLIALSFVPTTS